MVKLILKSCVWPEDLNDFNLVKCAPNIEGLSIKFNSEFTINSNTNFHFANELVELEKLKYLALDTRGADVKNFLTILAKRNSLSYLSLTQLILNMDGFSEAFANMHNLKVLRMNSMIFLPQDMFKKLCKNLVNLEELCLSNGDIFVQQIKDIVENAVNLRKLYFQSIINSASSKENLYSELVELQCRKKADWPLTIYFLDDFYFEIFIRSIPSRVSLMNSNVILFLKCDLSDDYALPV